MNPATQDAITQIATVVGPAILAFLAGHFKVFTGGNKPATPAVPGTPATPTAPIVLPGTTLPVGQGGILQMLGLAGASLAPAPGQPVAAIGHGGLLQIAGLFIAGIINGPGAAKDKAAAASAVINATEPFIAADTSAAGLPVAVTPAKAV